MLGLRSPYEGAGWKINAPLEVSFDHGSLSGLSDNDHPQYPYLPSPTTGQMIAAVSGAWAAIGTTKISWDDSTGALSTQDADVTHYFGRAAVGYGGGYSDYAYFGHRDLAGSTGSYAVLQAAAGHTIINAAAGSGTVYFRVNNSTYASVTTAGLSATALTVGTAAGSQLTNLWGGTNLTGSTYNTHINYSTDEHSYYRGGKSTSSVMIGDVNANTVVYFGSGSYWMQKSDYYGVAYFGAGRSGWAGFEIYNGTQYRNCHMADGSGNFGLYSYAIPGQGGTNVWALYYSNANNCWGVNTSTTYSTYSMYVSGAGYFTSSLYVGSTLSTGTSIVAGSYFAPYNQTSMYWYYYTSGWLRASGGNLLVDGVVAPNTQVSYYFGYTGGPWLYANTNFYAVGVICPSNQTSYQLSYNSSPAAALKCNAGFTASTYLYWLTCGTCNGWARWESCGADYITYTNGNGTRGCSSWASHSKYKDNIRPIEVDHKKLYQLKGKFKSFEYKDTGKTDFGLVADEIVDIMPEILTWKETEEGAYGDLEPFYVKYELLSVLALQEIYELNDRIAKLEAKNNG